MQEAFIKKIIIYILKKIFIAFLFLFPVLLFAQNEGIQFQKGMSWSQVKAKAKAENKYIFMDCYTTWCSPCKYMSVNIFPLKNVGDVINKSFVAVAVQFDTTENDNEFVKSWYRDGHNIAIKYSIHAFPTYLFFSPDGKLVHRALGSFTGDAFITKAENALDPSKQYYTLLAKYEGGQKDSSFLRSMAVSALDAGDRETANKVARDYLATQTDLFTKGNLDFIKKFIENSKDKGFEIMLNNSDKVDAVLGKGVANGILQKIILSEEVIEKIPRNPDVKPDWNKITTSLKAKYPSQADEVLAKGQIIYNQYFAKDWQNLQPAIVDYMKKYSDHASPEDLDSYAWTAFQNCEDTTCLTEALDWSKRSFAENKNPMFMDTYANILYKLGKKEEAISWEQKAIDLLTGANKESLRENLEKMKRGEKIWE